jgi:hypothetical protein
MIGLRMASCTSAADRFLRTRHRSCSREGGRERRRKGKPARQLFDGHGIL